MTVYHLLSIGAFIILGSVGIAFTQEAARLMKDFWRQTQPSAYKGSRISLTDAQT